MNNSFSNTPVKAAVHQVSNNNYITQNTARTNNTLEILRSWFTTSIINLLQSIREIQAKSTIETTTVFNMIR